MARAAFATGRLPWELELDALEYRYLMALDGLGLVPDPLDAAWRIGRCFADVSREDFGPNVVYGNPRPVENDIKERLNKSATGTIETVEFE